MTKATPKAQHDGNSRRRRRFRGAAPAKRAIFLSATNKHIRDDSSSTFTTSCRAFSPSIFFPLSFPVSFSPYCDMSNPVETMRNDGRQVSSSEYTNVSILPTTKTRCVVSPYVRRRLQHSKNYD